MKTYKLIAVAGLALMSAACFAQEQTVLDGVYIKEHTPGRRPIMYPQGRLIREADVMWHTRIWRRIDLRQKINHPLYYPEKPIQDRKSMFDVIKDAVLNEGTLTAYNTGFDGTNDEFTEPMTADDVKKMLFSVDTSLTEDPVTGEFVEVLTPMEVKSMEIKLFELKEDWFFDRQRSVMDVRIVGICPIKEAFDEYGEFKGFQRMFWIYFPEARHVFANIEVFNRWNDAERRTLEDIFMKRMFGSYIIKRSNVYDRFIGEYKVGLGALLEAESVKEEIFNFEHDLWHF